jgi:uncharacterized protein (TIGR02246 family)
MRLSTLVVCAALTTSPALASPSEDLASARPTIEAVNTDWVTAMKAGDAARVAAAYAPDAVFITADRQLVAGHDAIQALIRQRLDSGLTIVGGGLRQKGLTALGPGLLLEWGEGGLDFRTKDGKAGASFGPYATVWRREPDGGWKIVRNLSF